ncbi:hypothetical protein [Streptococcus hyovaginalis]|uniref:hypothetical protein n=1 Tax=Streptococcus hyovaginalis TaxID=149015 RepID=UPI0014785827|nr:hypothetical protein [Streptococcus hyovaginalis]
MLAGLLDECISKYKSSTPELSKDVERYIRRRLGIDEKPNKNNILASLEKAEQKIEGLGGVEFPNNNYKTFRTRR